MAVPVTRLYDRGNTLLSATVLQSRIPEPTVYLNPQDVGDGTSGVPGEASGEASSEGLRVVVTLDNREYQVLARLDQDVPAGVVLVPRSMGLPVIQPVIIELQLISAGAAIGSVDA